MKALTFTVQKSTLFIIELVKYDYHWAITGKWFGGLLYF
jgi:hypothetical protein